jgi:hypothetical protein
MNLGLTLEIVILSRHGSVAPYVTLALRVTIVPTGLLPPPLPSYYCPSPSMGDVNNARGQCGAVLPREATRAIPIGIRVTRGQKCRTVVVKRSRTAAIIDTSALRARRARGLESRNESATLRDYH